MGYWLEEKERLKIKIKRQLKEDEIRLAEADHDLAAASKGEERSRWLRVVAVALREDE